MSRRNPYKLFDYYTEADAEVFFGREREVSAVLGDILANKLLVLFAASGSGKTSLLNAGIGPALREIGLADGSDPGIRMITIRLAGGVPPEESALRAIRTELREAGEDGETLHQVLRRLCAIPKPELAKKDAGLSKPPLGLVLVFDQFEELFISLFKDQPETRREFGVKLAEIIHDETLRAYVVLSLRSDHFHHLNEFRSLIPSIFQNNTNLELRSFDHEAALRVIRGPADRSGSGFSWEPGLPERIARDLEKLGDERGRVLPIHLQIVCYDLFERLAAADEMITVAHYESTADTAAMADGSPPAAAMIRRRIIAPLEAITDRERRRWLYRLLREMMTAEGAKFPRSLTGLARVVPLKHLPALLEYLEKRLLVRRIAAESETYYELRHDFLARRISPWLEARENELRASDRRRRSVAIGVAILLTGLITKLWIDWSTFTAYLGFDPRPDELRLERKAPFGMSAPSWWKRNIFTGYTRSQLLAAGLKQHLFAVERPLTEWKEVGDQLNPQDRWLLQLATRLETEASKPDATEAIFFETIQHPDIKMLAIADRRILDLVLSGLKSGDLKARRSAAETLGYLSEEFTPERIDIVVEALLVALRERDSSVKGQVAWALGRLGEKLPPDRVGAVIEGLLAALKEREPVVNQSAAKALAGLGKRLPPKHVGIVVESLLATLNAQDFNVRRSGVEALDSLAENLPPEHVEQVVEMLLAALKEQNLYVKISVAEALSKFGEKLPPERTSTVIDALLVVLKEQNLDVKISIASALGNLSKKLPAEVVSTVVETLLRVLKEKDALWIQGGAAKALDDLGEKLPPERVGELVEMLLAALKDQNSDFLFKAWVTRSLKTLGEKLPAERVTEVVEALLPALKAQDSSFKGSVAKALGDLAGMLSADDVSPIVEALLSTLDGQDFKSKESVAEALESLGERLPPDRVGAVVDALLPLLKQQDRVDQQSAASALGALGNKLPAERVGMVVESLLAVLKQQDFDVKRSGAKALGRLVEELPLDHTESVVEMLLVAIKEKDSFVRSSVAEALGRMREKLPSERIVPVCEVLLAALKGQDFGVKKSAAVALGRLSEKLPQESVVPICEALLAVLKEQDSDDKSSAASSLAVLGARTASSEAPSFFLELDALPSLSFPYFWETTRKRTGFLTALRTLAAAKWPQTDADLVARLESDDGRWRTFALHVLARRQPLGPEVQKRILALRNDPKGRPWVKLAALRCLVEIERENNARRDNTAKKPN